MEQTNNKRRDFILSGVWVSQCIYACFFIVIYAISLVDFYSFEYYGYSQWPWFYENKVLFLRYTFSLIVLFTLCIGYSYRYLKQNRLKALFIATIPICVTLYEIL